MQNSKQTYVGEDNNSITDFDPLLTVYMRFIALAKEARAKATKGTVLSGSSIKNESENKNAPR